MASAVCLLSGGLDSATCLALARRDGYACYALSFDYGQRHSIDSAMALGTSDAFLDVDAVIEVNEAGQPMDTLPRDGSVASKAFAHRFEHLAPEPDLLMAVHAGLARRHSRERRRFDGRVAVAAIDAEISDVMGMAKRDRLQADDLRVRRQRTPARPPRYGGQSQTCGYA